VVQLDQIVGVPEPAVRVGDHRDVAGLVLDRILVEAQVDHLARVEARAAHHHVLTR
jgi:hypothetical protein